METEEKIHLEACNYHKRQDVCRTRSQYRRGRRETAVKVFTIAQESRYLLIQNLPIIDVYNELLKLCQRFGQVDYLKAADYPCPQFTQVYLVKYNKIGHAIVAKKRLDDFNLFGSVLHVCYAPELEDIEETREKLTKRKEFVVYRLGKLSSQRQDMKPIGLSTSDEIETMSGDGEGDEEVERRKNGNKRPLEKSEEIGSAEKKPKLTPKIRWKT